MPALATHESLLAVLRGVEGLREKSPGTFYVRSKPFLHFHHKGDDVHADLKVAGEWKRLGVNTPAERSALIARVEALCAAAR